MMLPGDFNTLLNYFSFSAWIIYGATSMGVIVLRIKQPDAIRPIKVCCGNAKTIAIDYCQYPSIAILFVLGTIFI